MSDRIARGAGSEGVEHLVEGSLVTEPLAPQEVLVRLLNERLGHFIATVVSDRTGNAAARLAYTIASLYNPVLFPRTPDVLDMPQEDLGIFAGLSRQMTNRCLKTLSEEGLVEITPRGVKVLDVKALVEFGDAHGAS